MYVIVLDDHQWYLTREGKKVKKLSEAIPTVIIVGADKGGVGKTTVARALLDYLDSRQVKFRSFDCEWPSGDLRRFRADAEVIDVMSVQSQMRIFDGAVPGTVTVLDLRGGMLSPTLRALDDAKLLEEVHEGRMQLVLLHVLGPTMASISEISEAAKKVSGGSARHFLVKNHINQTQFFEWDREESQATWQRMHDITVDVPQLAEIACETLQKTGGGFVDFSKDEANSRTLRGLVRTWLEAVWAEFDRVKLWG